MPDPVTKTPRLVRRGDVVKIKGTDEDMPVRAITIVLHLGNGLSESYDSGEAVVMGEDTDLSPAEIVEAAGLDAAERAQKAVAADAALAAAAATAAAAQQAAAAFQEAQAAAQAQQDAAATGTGPDVTNPAQGPSNG